MLQEEEGILALVSSMVDLHDSVADKLPERMAIFGYWHLPDLVHS